MTANTPAPPPDAAAASEPEPAPPPSPARTVRDRVRSPTLREIGIGVLTSLLVAAIVFGVTKLWGTIFPSPPSGSIAFKSTADAFTSRKDFYERFAHRVAPAGGRSGMGAVFLVSTTGSHTSSCALRWTAQNMQENQPVEDASYVDQPAQDVAGSLCDGSAAYVWVPWACVPSGTELQYELTLVSGTRQLDQVPTQSFPVGGDC